VRQKKTGSQATGQAARSKRKSAARLTGGRKSFSDVAHRPDVIEQARNVIQESQGEGTQTKIRSSAKAGDHGSWFSESS